MDEIAGARERRFAEVVEQNPEALLAFICILLVIWLFSASGSRK